MRKKFSGWIEYKYNPPLELDIPKIMFWYFQELF